MRPPLKQTLSSSKGFSLVEMLTVISVIGIIASIAIPSIGSISTSAKSAVAQRNAQSLVSMFAAGQAAGLTWTGATRNALVASVISGQSPTDGPFIGKTFRVPNITSTDLAVSYKYIGKDTDGNLFYDRSGTQSST
jgi:prepilin-type N-terminal cleavage/methylation domain-containing protein